jgi:alpha-ketoglutaric semialdehyde dehydrogenase
MGTIRNINPATGKLINLVPESTPAEMEAAVQRAKAAYRTWRKVPVAKRGELLLKSMRILEKNKEKFAREMTEEMGKPLKETRGDVQEAIDTAFYYAGEGRRFFGQTTTSELPKKFAMTVRMPVGVCGLITPWNFPMAIPSWKIYPALLCGNTVILKPSSLTPNSARNFVHALEEAGIPPGVVDLIYGEGAAPGQFLLNHRDVTLISFTGSTKTGGIVGETCGRLHKKCSLELGGKNAMIVMEDADLDLALEGALWGAFGTTGQRCTATSRIILHDKIYDRFTRRLVERARKLRVGDGLDAKTEVGPLVSQTQLETVRRYVDIGLNFDKAKLLLGGKPLAKGAYAKGFFFEPTILSGTAAMRIAQEEIFGPVTVLIKVKSFNEAMSVLNGTFYGLSGSLYTQNIERAMNAIADMETGITYINAPTIGAEVHLPFGGVKKTGNGHREAGTAALDIFSEWKAVYIDYSGRLQKAQIDTDGRKS